MTTRAFSFAGLFVALAMVLSLTPDQGSIAAAQVPSATRATTNSLSGHTQPAITLGSSPVMFIENVGQFAEDARFQVRGAGDASVWLAQDAVWMTLLKPTPGAFRYQEMEARPQPGEGVNLRLRFVGANPNPQLVPFDRLDTKVSYFIGNNPGQWRSGVPVWGGVRYVDLYPGIDLELTGTNGQYTQRLVIHEGADPNTVRLRVDGADTLIPENDRLTLRTSVGEFSLPLFQAVTSDGALLDLEEVQPQVSGVEVAVPFSIPSQRSSSAAPQDSPDDLLYGTFLGGWEWDRGLAIALDGWGNMYVTGETWSYDFPTTPGAIDPECGSDGYCDPHEYGQIQDAFVVKLNANGTQLEYATFLGGGNADEGYAIAVDGAGCAYLGGLTGSSDFPTTLGVLDWTCGTDGHCNFDGSDYLDSSPFDAYVVKLSADGLTLAYATFLGGSDLDYARGIDVDGTGNVYVTGSTQSSNFPTTLGAFDRTYNGGDGDGFVTKINATGSALVYSTYLGGSGLDWGAAIQLDGVGNAFVAGSTESSTFPITVGAFDPSHNGDRDAFVAKLNAGGTGLTYSAFLGGGDRDSGSAIAVDAAGSAYVAGSTSSSSFPATVGAFDTTYGGNQDAFVAKVSATGTGLVYATFLGGTETEYIGNALAVNGQGSAFVVGSTESSNFPTTPDAFDASCGTDGNCNFDGSYRPADAFVTRLNASGTSVAYSTFLGGSKYDGGQGIAIDGVGHAFVTGETYSTNFPTTVGAYDQSHNGQRDAFVTKLVATKYAISGRVRQANGNPFAGVTVQTDTGRSDVTDVNGLYTLDDLPPSTYTLTPFRSGYTFSPTTRVATLPPDTAGQSFTILPLPVSTMLYADTPGSLDYIDTQGLLTSLAFPAGAVDQTTMIVLTPALAPGAGGFTFAGHAFELEASQAGIPMPGLPFGAPVTVTIHYSDDDVRVVTDESQLALWWHSESGWQDAAQTCDPASAYIRDEANNALSVPVCHLSLFGLFGPTHQRFLPLVFRQLP